MAWLILHHHARALITLFARDPLLIDRGVDCLQLATLFLPVMGPIIVLSHVLQALGKGTAACGFRCSDNWASSCRL
jgi:Na+-driven multidrug efflux pump